MITAVLTSPVTIKVMRVVASVAVTLHVKALAKLRVLEVGSFNRLIRRIIDDPKAVIDQQSHSFILATI